MARKFGEPVNLTVGFFTQLLGTALGLDERALGVQRMLRWRLPEPAGARGRCPCPGLTETAHRRRCPRRSACTSVTAAITSPPRSMSSASPRSPPSLPGVTVARDYKFMCSDPGQELIQQDIRDGLVNRVVVASCSPLMHGATFRRATEAGGISPFYSQMASIREHVSWVTADSGDATEKANALVAGAVRRVAAHEQLDRRRAPVHPDVLVVGGGIGGIHAALTLADAGKHVYLVEREPCIGGQMAKFDKTFPTLDCAACILTPKMVQVGQHPNIDLLSFSEVKEVSGYVGNFKVKVRRKARYINEDACTGCNLCVENCTWDGILSEFDYGLGTRPVAYKPFPQAVPACPVIDRAGTSRCTFSCPAGDQGPRLCVTRQEGRVREGVQPRARRDAPGRQPGPGLLRAVRDGVHQGEPGGPAADPAAEALHRGHPLRPGSAHRDRGGSPERQAGRGGRLGTGRPDRRLAARAQGLPRQDLRGCARAWRHAQAGHPRLPAARVGSRAGHRERDRAGRGDRHQHACREPRRTAARRVRRDPGGNRRAGLHRPRRAGRGPGRRRLRPGVPRGG